MKGETNQNALHLIKFIYLTPLLLLPFLSQAQNIYPQNHKKADSLFYWANATLKWMLPPPDTAITIAIQAYTKAIQYDTTHWSAYRNRARLYLQRSEYLKAINDLTNSLCYAPPGHTELHSMLAEAYYHTEDYKAAIIEWAISIEDLPNVESFWIGLAKSYWKLGQRQKACVYFQKAVAIDKRALEDKGFLECN
ncbi:tetratricopeptide repeat protein [Xanthocytophaga agilis]|uniref:Tetratricopeptide repeat protein n=1 Tax=Xanthocytophaga agilis TaxID=3048010 RepID=A0AAE3RC49_9BACT|nr:tetratricopeptide repeat protein [Xanthocytophaga agilis]MDJ1504952.1 tetratricopeptide repeat protein [Xanthocytophaga agilis]